ncbi:MAG TPA: hypothetical protein VL336_07055 [Sphingomicrobium sp.]|nr:hypothetical protein [Sphingomicrobium sp.]
MNRRAMILSAALACAACGKSQQDSSPEPPPIVENTLPEAPPVKPETIKPGEPGGLPDDRTPISEGAIDPKSGQGAGQVLQLFGGLLEQRRFGEAYRLWSDSGRASGLSEPQFIAAYDKYAEIHSEVGAPAQMEGAAGSSYVDIPFRLYGKLKSGGPFNLVGTVTLRRVNDVPGSSDEQRRWHIYKSDLDARP